MENYFYKCPVCGAIHLVPADEEDAEPEEEILMAHLDIKRGKMCFCKKLRLLMDKK